MSGKSLIGQGFELLESRLCPTTFQYESLAAYLNINPLIAELGAPAGSNAINFGVSVAGLGDIDGDQVPDFAVGADGVAPGGGFSAAGKVFLYSGKTRGLIRTLEDGSIGFGRALANLGDVNGDGVPDLAVGSPTRAVGTSVTGAVIACSGADGSVLWEVVGDAPAGQLGRALATIMDVDADGVANVAAGGRVGTTGEVRILSGASGALITTLSEGSGNESFGSALAAMPGTGAHNAILAVGAPRDGDGKVYTYTQAWAGAHTYAGQWTGGAFGSAIAMLGGYLTVGAPDAVVSEGLGLVVMYDLSGPFGRPDAPNLVKPKSATDHFGYALADVGDLNGDGLRDLGVGQTDGGGAGNARFISFGTTSHGSYIISEITPFPADVPLLGGSIALLGDVNGDGFADLLTGSAAPGQSLQGATIVSGVALSDIPTGTVTGGTADLKWLWYYGRAGESGLTRLRYFVRDGAITSIAAVPGVLDGDWVLGLSDSGGIAVVDSQDDHAATLTYIRNGQRLTIAQAITSVVGPGLDTSLLTFVRVGAGGHIIFTVTHPTIREQSSAWILDPDGTLRFLWNGIAADVNAGGDVVGTRFLAGNGNEAVARLGGVVGAVPGMNGAQAINSARDIAGWGGADEIVLVRNGVPMVLGHVSAAFSSSSGALQSFAVERLDDAGRLLGVASFTNGGGQLYYDQASGLIALAPNIIGWPAQAVDAPLGIDGGGALVGTWFALVPVDPRIAYGARDPGTRVVISGPDGVQIVATNIAGQSVVFTLDAGTGQWRGRDARTGVSVSDTEQGFVSWVDPYDGLTYVMYITDHFGAPATAMIRDASGILGAPQAWAIYADGSAFGGIVSDLALFTSTDGAVHIVGRDDAGELVMLTRNLGVPTDGDAWNLTNISRDHLQFQGMATPAWVGAPVAYVTSWNAFNLAGLNSAGEVEVVWIAPGMALWRTDNLSAIASAPALSGGITAFTTGWGGINVVGATVSGDLTTIWWAPALGGQWLTSSLSEAAGSTIKLRAETLTSWVTPWGGLNVAGVDENGGVTIFWWSLTSDVWTASTVTADVSPVASPAGPLSAAVTSTGAVHIGGVSTTGHVIDLSWKPGGSWELTDLTVSAV